MAWLHEKCLNHPDCINLPSLFFHQVRNIRPDSCSLYGVYHPYMAMVDVTPLIEAGPNFTVVKHGSNISNSSSSNAHLSSMRFSYRLDSRYRNRAQSYMHRALRKQNDIYNSSLKMPLFPSVRLAKTCLSPGKNLSRNVIPVNLFTQNYHIFRRRIFLIFVHQTRTGL